MVAYDQMNICISLLEFDRSIMDFPNHDIDFHRHMSCARVNALMILKEKKATIPSKRV
jgi:hypothetical protein